MARRLSREFSEFKAALGRRLSREPSRDKITISEQSVSKKDRKKSRDLGHVNVTGNRKMSNNSDLINSSKDRSSNGSTTDSNSNIDGTILDFNGDKMPRKSSTSDLTKNPNRKIGRSISNVKKFIPVLYDGMPYNIQEQAALELNETDENIQKGLTKLKNYMKKEKLPPLDDDYLMACLRGSKFEFKKAQEKLKRYYQMRRKMAESLEKLDLETALRVIRKKLVGFLPDRDEAGRAILFTRGIEWYPEVCDFEDFVLVTYVVIFHLVSIPVTTVSGMRYLCDVQARSYNQYYQYYKAFKANLSLSNTLPLRLQLDCIHDNAVCHWLCTLLRPLIPTKLAKRMRLHGYDYDSLHQEIDFSILPEEYGGTTGPLSTEFMIEKFEKFFLKFKAENALFMKE